MPKEKNGRSKAGKAPDHPRKTGGSGRSKYDSITPESSGKTNPPPVNFPVVGIGASSGGLEAFEDFFSGMPYDKDPDMAFVLVQHLSPDHICILPDLIQQHTRLQVLKIEDGMAVHPNTVYIIPVYQDLIFQSGTLQLMDPRTPQGQRMPVDLFFRSLAEDQKHLSIGIVLSGTGADGTLGVRAIKGEGGMVMAQKPESAEHRSMPCCALDTGLVDYELPPAGMPAQLMDYAAHFFEKAPLTVAVPADKKKRALKKIFFLLNSRTGHDFSQYRPNAVERRVERRMAVNRIETVEEYQKYAAHTPEELDALFRELLIGTTRFFRDPEAFRVLEKVVIPELFAGKQKSERIRIWVPGCSTGEEAYSLAILLAEHQEKIERRFDVQIFGTEIDSRAIAAARAGLYPAGIANDMTPERLERFFSSEPDNHAYRINRSLREMLIFSRHDLIKDPPFSGIDLISCRNLLIYMEGNLQKKIFFLFHQALNNNGFLFLGNSETASEYPELFAAEDRMQKIYRRKKTYHGQPHAGPANYLPPSASRDRASSRPAAKAANTAEQSLREVTEQTILEQMAPSAALVNGQGDILYLHGRTGEYLELPPGKTGTHNIIKMAREGMRRKLTTGLQKAAQGQHVVYFPQLRVNIDGSFTPINLTIRTVARPLSKNLDVSLYLIIFEKAPTPEQTVKSSDRQTGKDSSTGRSRKEDHPGQEMKSDDEASSTLSGFRQELHNKEEYIQTIGNLLETSREDLKFNDEKWSSINQELGSTREKLESFRQELQSLNEELSAVNADLQAKTDKLNRADNDIKNLIAGTNTGIIFVDRNLRIFRFTPAVTQIIDLIESDLGRSLDHILTRLEGYDTLSDDVQHVLSTLEHKIVNVQTKDGARYMMTIQPYRTLENVIEGAVISFEDLNGGDSQNRSNTPPPTSLKEKG